MTVMNITFNLRLRPTRWENIPSEQKEKKNVDNYFVSDTSLNVLREGVVKGPSSLSMHV